MTTVTLTNEAIDALEAGAELDRLVATLVMGQTKVGECPLGDPTCDGKWEPQVGRIPCLPRYSTNIETAWEVVERLCSAKFFFKMNYEFMGGAGCFAAFDDKGAGDGNPPYGVRGKTAPVAICKSALKAVLDVVGNSWRSKP